MVTDDPDEDVGDAVEDVDTDVEEASSSPPRSKKMSVLKFKSKELVPLPRCGRGIGRSGVGRYGRSRGSRLSQNRDLR